LGKESTPPPFVANNVSSNTRICLITDAPQSSATLAAWSGIEAAARRTPINA
jgi:hypothetical protein